MPNIESYNVEKKYSDTNDKYVKSIIIPVDFTNEIGIKGISYDEIIDGLTKNMIVFKDRIETGTFLFPDKVNLFDGECAVDISGYTITITKDGTNGRANITADSIVIGDGKE